MKSAAFVLPLLLVAAPAPADDTKPPVRASGAVETSILEIEAVVTDRDGKPVTGLQASDFEVRIGGKPVAIENFYERRAFIPAESTSALAAPVAVPKADPAVAPPARPPHHLVLFVDRLHLIEKWKADATFDALRATLRRVVSAPGDDAMIVTWDSAVGTVVPFTEDLSAIERVLERERRLSRSPLPEDTTVRNLQDEGAWFARVREDVIERSGGAPLPSSGVEVSQRAAAAEAYARMRSKGAAIRALCAAIGGLPGRKILVLASHRFSELAGLEFHLTGPVRYGEIPVEAREFNARGIVDAVALAANANGVTLYTFFPPGWPDEAMVVSAAAAASSNPHINDPVEGARGDMIVMNEAAALEPLALATGGTFTLGYKEGPALAARVAADADSSYSLGVAAPGGKRGKTLSVDVRAKDRSLKVRSRRSTVDRTPEERVEARVLSNLFRPERASRLGVDLESAAVEARKGKTTVALRLRVPIAPLVRTPTDRGESGAFSVFVASASADGAFSEVVRQRQPFEIPRAEAARAGESFFTYELPVVLGSPDAHISIGVWDEAGREAGFLLVDVRDGRAVARR